VIKSEIILGPLEVCSMCQRLRLSFKQRALVGVRGGWPDVVKGSAESAAQSTTSQSFSSSRRPCARRAATKPRTKSGASTRLGRQRFSVGGLPGLCRRSAAICVSVREAGASFGQVPEDPFALSRHPRIPPLVFGAIACRKNSRSIWRRAGTELGIVAIAASPRPEAGVPSAGLLDQLQPEHRLRGEVVPAGTRARAQRSASCVQRSGSKPVGGWSGYRAVTHDHFHADLTVACLPTEAAD